MAGILNVKYTIPLVAGQPNMITNFIHHQLYILFSLLNLLYFKPIVDRAYNED